MVHQVDCHCIALRLMSKEIKAMYEWSLVINLFRWLTIQTTFKIDSILCNCVCIFKTIPKQCCLDYYIKRKKYSSFIEIYRVFPWETKARFARYFWHHYERMKPWSVPQRNALDILKTWHFVFSSSLNWKIQFFMTPN